MIPVVSFYTVDTPYEQEIMEMEVSANEVGLTEIHLYPVRSKGSWEANCQQKAAVLQQAAEDLKKPFLYVDADARFQKFPTLLTLNIQEQYDIAVHYFQGWELLSGTLWINPTPYVKVLLAEWVRYNREQPRAWDQRTLHEALRYHDQNRILRLPTEYCYIFDLSPRIYGERSPVIVHYQASRKYKRGMK